MLSSSQVLKVVSLRKTAPRNPLFLDGGVSQVSISQRQHIEALPLKLWQGGHSRLNSPDVTELLDGVFRRDHRGDDDVVTGNPVDSGVNTVVVGGLQGIDNSQDLSGVAAGGGGVAECETDLFVGVDDENRADGQGHS